MRFLLMISLLCFSVVGCAYPRRGTSLSPVRHAGNALDRPANVWQLEFVSAVLPPEKRGALPWDDDSPPDAFLRVFVGGEQIWEGASVPNSLAPTFHQSPPHNVFVSSDQELRFELWDDDGAFGSDLIGEWRSRGWPRNAQPGNDTRVMFDGRATLVFRIQPPQAHRGVGVKRFEIRSDALLVLELQPFSPAVRAGVEVGDRIVEINGRPITELRDAQAVTALSMSSQSEGTLVVERHGRRETLHLDGGFVWLTM